MYSEQSVVKNAVKLSREISRSMFTENEIRCGQSKHLLLPWSPVTQYMIRFRYSFNSRNGQIG